MTDQSFVGFRMLMKTHSLKANGLHLLFAFADDAPVKLLN
jgi:hypothetical protein